MTSIAKMKGATIMASSHDIKDSERTYSGFVTALKWVVPAAALVVFFVVILIA